MLKLISLASACLIGSLCAQIPGQPKVILRKDIAKENNPAKLKAFDAEVKRFYAKRLIEEKATMQQAMIQTNLLGTQTMKGNIAFGIKSMYPRWKKNLVLKAGNENAMLLKFVRAVRNMEKQGIAIVDFKVKAPKKIHYVWPKRQKGLGVVRFPMDFNFQKLMIVPTDLTVNIPNQKTGKVVKLLKQTFQVVIYDPATSKWSFVDGSDLTINDIRTLFPLLPLAIKEEMVKGGKQLN